MELLLAYSLCFGSVLVGGVSGYRLAKEQVSEYLRRRSLEASQQLGEMFLNMPRQRLWWIYALSPLAVGMVTWLLTERWAIGLVGAAFGVLAPKLLLRHLESARRGAFHKQLVDALLTMSSSLKAGMSMMQAFGVVAEEMPPPASQEFGLLLKQVRMGISVDEAIANLKRRMPSDDLTLLATAIMVSRETGGDITHLFGRLVETIRERKKLKERVKTLTFMSRLQGVVMGLLPVAFAFVVFNMNKDYFRFFLHDPAGRVLLAIVLAFQVAAGLLFLRFARSPL